MKAGLMVLGMMYVAAHCDAQSNLPSKPTSGETDAEWKTHLAVCVEAVRAKSSIKLFKGLPNPLRRQEEWAKEKATKKTVAMGGFFFYDPPSPLHESISKKLIDTYVTGAAFTRWSGSKYCGGFHPDVCIEIVSADTIFQVQLCFTCAEMKTLHEGRTLVADMTKATYNAFGDALGWPAGSRIGQSNRPGAEPPGPPIDPDVLNKLR